jgi:HPr kinase/phosphorylase
MQGNGTVLSVDDLSKALSARLRLRWLAGERAKRRLINMPLPDGSTSLPLVGYLNPVHANQIQIVGDAEFEYLLRQDPARMQMLLDDFFPEPCGMMLLCDQLRLPDPWRDACEKAGIPVCSSPSAGHEIMDIVVGHFAGLFGERKTVHGVLMEVQGVGVLITGPSGIGKSELALELLTRGHRLIADDCPEFKRISADTIDGICPPEVRNFLEVRGLGLIDVRAMFGNASIKRNKYLRLIVNLLPLDKVDMQGTSRFSGLRRERVLMGVTIPEITLPVTAGRNLAVLLETAVRDHLLRLSGYESDKVFEARHNAALAANGLDAE